MVNKHLIDKIIMILMIVDIFLGTFFLAVLLIYTSIFEASFSFSNPLIYVVFILLAIIPTGVIIYYIYSSKERKNEDFVFNQDSYLKIKELNRRKNIEKDAVRFSKLLEIDNENHEVAYDKITNLRDFCEDFRNFCSSKLDLFYSIDDIRAFISNLLTSKTMILQGMSGTGKTSIVIAFEKYVNNLLEPIAIQPMWKERSDLIGYYNEFTKKFNETVLLEELYKSNFDDKIYIIILDEVNLARIEYYFAEFLSTLELPDEEARNLEVTNDTWLNDPKKLKEGKVHIGPNVYFLGTANNDESTFAISDKVYDRAMVINLDKKATAFKGEDVNPKTVSNKDFIRLGEEAVSDFEDKKESLELDKWISFVSELLNDKFFINFGNRMVKQIKVFIPVYMACGGSAIDAFDDFFSKKILRKLESKDYLKLGRSVNSFIERMDGYFGKENMKKSKEYLSRYIMF